MVLTGKGSIYQHVKSKMYVYIPAAVRDDSQFPFKPGEKVKVSIKDNKLIVEKEK
jgi:AbrB family looped-hinge helix DNA binding protein